MVVGSLNMDMTAEVDALPSRGETILGYSLSCTPGGKGANQAYTIGKLGYNAVMLGSVGKEEFGRALIENLKRVNVDVQQVEMHSDSPTGTAIICVGKEGENHIVVIPGANNDCSREYILRHREIIENSDYMLIQMEIPIEAVCCAIETAHRADTVVVLNPAPAPEEFPEQLYTMLDFITPNETELMKLTGIENDSLEEVIKGADTLLEKGVENVLVTMGERGTLWVCRGQKRVFPANKVKANDTTAAGDCFNGAFVAALSEGKGIEDAIMFANAAAGITVTRKGAQDSIPTLKEVEKLYKRR